MLFDREDQDDQIAFSRRAMLIGAGQTALFGVLAAKLYGLQIIDGEAYALAADENRINIRLLAPVRGEIRDRFGRVVATNEARLRVLITPDQAGDVATSIEQVARLISLDREVQEKALATAKRQRRFLPVTIADDISWEDFSRLNLYGLHLPGVFTEVGWERRYPLGPVFGHVAGYVGAVSERELDGDGVLRLPGFQIGKTGIEKTEDQSLRGRAGTVAVEIEASGRVVRELERKPPDTGSELILSLDHDLQSFVIERLGEQVGAAVVIDVNTGDVLAMASTPSFDPRVFEGGVSRQEWAALTSDPNHPMTNRAAAGQYPPGSTFKIVTALAALAVPEMDPDATIRCTGAVHLGSHQFRCWKRTGHGNMNLHDALKRSCDVYFYRMAEKVGIDALAEMARKMGLGRSFDFAGSKPGIVPDIAWKRRAIGEPWYGGETLIAGIGQGYVLATPLQLAVMMARTANGRVKLEPRFVRSPAGDDTAGRDLEPLGVPAEHIALVQKGLYAVVNEPGGTAGRSKLEIPGIEMAGKTGTSQVVSSRRGEVKPGQEDHALFVAYAPVDAPRYAVAVVIEHGGGGSRAAAPVARDIITRVLEEQILARTPYDGSAEPPNSAPPATSPTGEPTVARG